MNAAVSTFVSRAHIRIAVAFLVFSSVVLAQATDLTEGMWHFRIGDFPNAAHADFDDSRWQRVSVPHTWNALDAQDGKPRTGKFRASGYRQTAAWYRQEIMIPEHYEEQRSFIRCESSSLVKHVYVNGQLVGEHSGAFTAFCFEITDYLKPGETAMLALRVDNSPHPEIPVEKLGLEPGRVELVAMGMKAGKPVSDRIVWEVEPPIRYATLKFDDMRPRDEVEGVTAIEQQVYDLLMQRGIPHAWGVCRLYGSDNPSFYAWLKARDAEGVEIWHHGNRHDRVKGESWEFKNRALASQLSNLRYTQERIFEKTGIVMQTFGAPYNRTDAATAEALNQTDDIQTMYFAQGSPEFTGLQLNDRVNLESKTGVVAALADFKASYAEKESADIIVLQAHPVYWDAEEELPKFEAILDFLEAQGRVFITPRNYFAKYTLEAGSL